mgnify:CR=1 FL=1
MLKNAMKTNETVKANDAELAALREHFAGCFTKEGAFDLKAFSARIRDQVAVTEEGYQLDFLGKNYARLLANEETETVIVPDEAHNAKPENAKSENVYISGDNLDALKHLLKSYEHEVKCIYIDPPYNTGSDGFVYNDNFKFKPEELARKLSITDEEAKKLLDFVGRGSASHSAWLMFMYPRLQLAKSLLRDDGVIFISIDDNEQANLKLLCDDIFGEQNFVANMVWEGAFKNDADKIGTNHEYVLVYAKRNDERIDWKLRKQDTDIVLKEVERLQKVHGNDFKSASEDLAGWFRANKAKPVFAHRRFHCIDQRGAYKEDDPTAPGGRKFGLVNPNTGRVIPLRKNRGWRFDQATFNQMVGEGRISFISDDSIMVRTYLHETLSSTPQSVFYQPARSASERLDTLFGADVFSFPKDEDVIAQFIEMSTDKDSLVVDFFSGSATTAHAILKLNSELLEKRRFIMVQLPENLDESLQHAAQDARIICQNAIAYLSQHTLPHTLDYIGMERIGLAARKVKSDNPLFAGDLGFKHFTLAKPSGEVLEKIEQFDPKASALATQNMLDEFGEGTVLATWLNHDGYGLTKTAEEIDLAGYKAYRCGKHLYLVHPLDLKHPSKTVIKALLEKYETEKDFAPDKIVLFGYSFGWKELEELDTNLRKLKVTRNITADLDIRY